MSHAWQSYTSWLVMVPLVLGGIFAGRVPVIVLARAAGRLRLQGIRPGDRPLSRLADDRRGLPGHRGRGPWFRRSTIRIEHVPGWYGLFAILPVYVIAAILLIPILRNRAEGQLQAIALAILGFLYIGWMFGHLAFLANTRDAYGYLLYLIFAVEVNDVAAYTFGKLFGRHPLRSNISPKKTWEGSLGALAVSMALPWVLRFSFPDFTALELILTGLIVGIAGQLGDLSMSVIKRDLGIKDMGTLIRGHGGILDRIDSLIYVTPLFFHMARWFHPL